MAVGWKKKGDNKQRRLDNMTSMELAKYEREEHERRKKAREFAIEQTAKVAAELFKKVPTVLIHVRPEHTGPITESNIDDAEAVNKHIRRWEFECEAVIKLAKEAMHKTNFKEKYGWNSDWRETGRLQMGRVIKQEEKSS